MTTHSSCLTAANKKPSGAPIRAQLWEQLTTGIVGILQQLIVSVTLQRHETRRDYRAEAVGTDQRPSAPSGSTRLSVRAGVHNTA